MARPPPYRLDFSLLETMDTPPRNLAKTIGGSFVKSDIARSRWAEFEAQHRRRATWLRELEAIKTGAGTLRAKVLEPVEKSWERALPPGLSYARDKTIRKPNCLGPPPIVGKN
ncbi:hypothetical protein ES708_19797 [subsurface metagenome]